VGDNRSLIDMLRIGGLVIMYYYITVKGHLDRTWSEWFDDMTITNVANGETVLAGEVVDQAALYGVLRKVPDLGLPLLTVCGTVTGQDLGRAAT
jgi:hypothetical protein